MAGVFRPDFVLSEPSPTVNPYLERALGGYKHRQRKQNVIGLVISAGAVVFAVAWVLLARPEDGWFCTPSALFLLPGAFGIVICGTLALTSRKVGLLDKLRTGIAIRKVRRDTTHIEIRRGLLRIQKQVPTIFVDFTDGKTVSLMSLGDLAQLKRIEELLHKQHEQQARRGVGPRVAASAPSP